MATDDSKAITFIGLGAMGEALARAVVRSGHRTTVWNRTPGKATALVESGASESSTVREAIAASRLVVVCLLDHDSVREVLDPVTSLLAGTALVNLTTTTPEQSRALGVWAAQHDVAYLDGGIMAVPEMIGGPAAAVLYSGSAVVFEEHRDVLDLWGDSSFFGPDAGMASLYDLAMLAGMYTMFAGFLHGAAMVGSEGVSATEFADRASPFLAAMTTSLSEYAAVIDGGDYSVEGQQSLEFSDLGDLVDATVAQGVSPTIIAPVQALIRGQIDAGHGKDGFVRIYEGIRRTP